MILTQSSKLRKQDSKFELREDDQLSCNKAPVSKTPPWDSLEMGGMIKSHRKQKERGSDQTLFVIPKHEKIKVASKQDLITRLGPAIGAILEQIP